LRGAQVFDVRIDDEDVLDIPGQEGRRRREIGILPDLFHPNRGDNSSDWRVDRPEMVP